MCCESVVWRGACLAEGGGEGGMSSRNSGGSTNRYHIGMEMENGRELMIALIIELDTPCVRIRK